MRLTNQQRISAINLFNDNKFDGVKYKYFVVSNALKNINIQLSISKISKRSN